MTQLFMAHPGPLDQPIPATSFEVRPAVVDDAAELAGTLTAAFEETWDVRRVRAELLEAPDVVRTWVALDGTHVLGTASERLLDRYPGAGYVHWVGVHPDGRGSGLGRILTQRCLHGFAERGLGRAVLETDDFRLPAVATYLRIGFVPEYRSDEERAAWSALFPRLTGPRSAPSHPVRPAQPGEAS